MGLTKNRGDFVCSLDSRLAYCVQRKFPDWQALFTRSILLSIDLVSTEKDVVLKGLLVAMVASCGSYNPLDGAGYPCSF